MSTGQFVIVSQDKSAEIVSFRPSESPQPLVEIESQYGVTVQKLLPVHIQWPKHTNCYVREIKTTCTLYAKHTYIKKGDLVVCIGASAYKLGTAHRGYVCDHCGFVTETPTDILRHLELPETAVILVKENADVLEPYTARKHDPYFQTYLNACSKKPDNPPFHLLPQLDANTLRSKLKTLADQK